MLWTWKRPAVAGFSSTLSFATRTRPAISAASSSITGATMRQGPHHGAHISSSTGTGERSTSATKVASVTVTGFVSNGRGVLHRPQTGLSPWAIFSCGTRFVLPQEEQRINCALAISSHFLLFTLSLGFRVPPLRVSHCVLAPSPADTKVSPYKVLPFTDPPLLSFVFELCFWLLPVARCSSRFV